MIKRPDGTIVLSFKPNIIKEREQITHVFEEDEKEKSKRVSPPSFPHLPPIIIRQKTPEELEQEQKEKQEKQEEEKRKQEEIEARKTPEEKQKEKEQREQEEKRKEQEDRIRNFREQKVGKGTYGSVYTSVDGNVVKRYKILENGIQVDMVREIAIMKMFSHPNILSCLSYDLSKKEIVMPCYTYNLQDYINEHSLSSEMIQTIFYSCCKAIYTLHSRNIVHRDIKPDNILMNLLPSKNGNGNKGEMEIVLCDYGMSRPLKGDMTGKVCTIWYRPFELFVGHKDYGTELDVWSLGCVLGEMLLEEPLFPHKTGIEMIQHQLKLLGTPEKCDFNFKNVKLPRYKGDFEKVFYNVETDSKYILKRMLDLCPETRISISEVLTFITDKFHVSSSSTYNAYLKNYKNYNNFKGNKENNEKFVVSDEDRTLLVDWMMDLRFNSSLGIDDHTYFRALSIMDQYLNCLNLKNKENWNVKKDGQLVAACCIWLSSKIEGRIEENELVDLGDDSYTLVDLVKMEKEIAKALDFNFLNPTLIDYIDFYDGDVYYELLNRVYAVTLTRDFHSKSLKAVVKDCYNYEEPYVIKAHIDYKARQFAV